MSLQVKPKFIDSGMTDDQELADGLALKQSLVAKNQPNGYAGLDSSGLIPLALLPPDIGTGSSGDVDGGSANSVYLTEDLDGGGA
jgi:hypothetical protein